MKTKVISLLLCLVMALSLVPAALAEGEDLSVYNGNEAVTAQQLEKNTGKTLTLTVKAEAAAYQWQIHIEGDLWANISGETGKALTVHSGMVSGRGSSAEFRCLMDKTPSDTVTVTLVEGQPAKAPAPKAPEVLKEAQPVGEPQIVEPAVKAAPKAEEAPANDPAEGDENPVAPAEEGQTDESPAPSEAPVLENCVITINYVFANGEQAAPSWTATIAKGSNYKAEIASPQVVGYTPRQATYTVKVTDIQKDETYTVTYDPAEVKYVVVHFWQNTEDDDYTEHEREEKTAPTGSEVGGTLAKAYDGFSALLYDGTNEVAADGSTVVKIYYDREYYLLSLDLDGGYGAEPVYARYGTAVKKYVSTPKKSGYDFAGWTPDIPDIMPATNSICKATWTAKDGVEYTVQYWQENANDTDYSFYESVKRTARTGSTVSGSEDKTYDGFTYDHADQDVTVEGDGSSVVNVYYKRNVYTVKFYEDSWYGWQENAKYRITAKYGAFIGDQWPGGGWYVDKSGETAQSYLAIMPLNGKNFYGQQMGSMTATATYYVEVLPGESGTTVTVGGKTYKVHHTDSANYSYGLFGGGLTVTDEERYGIEGYTCNTSISAKNGDDYNGAKFYYDRKSFELVFDNQYGTTKTEQMLFEQVLSESQNYKDGYEAEYPAGLEPGAYKFGGWYQDKGCTKEVDWSVKMPAAKVSVYAKWTPVVHTVRFYQTVDKVGTTDIYQTIENIQHNTVIGETARPEAPKNGKYTFVGWFYMDDGVEKAFDFSMPINRDLDLYAKWNANVMVDFVIHYVLEGTETKVAEDYTGQALADTTQTFEAKTGTQLLPGFRKGFFPKVSSHNLEMNIDGKNEFTFEYVEKEKVPYTVRYLEKGTNKVLHEEKTVETSDAVITEKFVQINGYRPDAYQKRLVLAAEGNVITFWYEKDDVHAPVQIIHWIQNIEGDGYTEYQSSTDLNAVINEEQKSEVLDITGFEYVRGTAVAGEATTDFTKPEAPKATLTKEGLVLNLYYDRLEYSYVFKFLEQGTNTVLAEPVEGKARYGAQVSEKAKAIPGYVSVSGDTQSMIIATSDNERIFYYTEQEVTINYVVVPGCESMGQVDTSSEAVKVVTGTPKGSTPTANPGFKFVGWYEDEACTHPVDGSWVAANKLTPGKTRNYGTVEAPVMGYEAATYYAKFEYDVANLTITKTGAEDIDENQSFLFTVKIWAQDGTEEKVLKSFKVAIQGNESVTIKGIPAGVHYTITEDSSWSWRYNAHVATDVLNPGSNSVTITNSRINSKWLGGDAYCQNCLKPYLQ